MILGFQQLFPDGTRTYFREKILASLAHITEVKVEGKYNTYALSGQLAYVPKLHTIRPGHRWKAGMSIQMAYGVRTKAYKQFNKKYPELQTCVSVQKIKISWRNADRRPRVYIDKRELSILEIMQFIKNDGFSSVNCLQQFCEWFDKDLNGQLIHWTDLRY